MGSIVALSEWLFIKSIYGAGIIAALSYGAVVLVRKAMPKAPSPAIVATLCGIAALATLPSIPRYRFEEKALAGISGKGWIRVVNMTRWGALTEPLTWIDAPVGSIHIAMPNLPSEGGFRDVLLRYEEEPKVRWLEPDCQSRTLTVAQPDANGIFRETSREPEPMTNQEVSLFCEYDWSNERKALLIASSRSSLGPN